MIAPTSEPKADGNLAKTPFAHLVVYLYQHRSSGTLLLGEADAPSVDRETATWVRFQRGRAVAAHFAAGPAESLELGLLPLCELRAAPFEFFEEDAVGDDVDVVTGMFDPHGFVAEAARRYPRPDIANDVLSRFAGTRLRIQLGVDVDRLRLSPGEIKLVEILRAGPSDIETLCSLSELPIDESRRLLYVLIIAKLVVPYEPKNPQSAQINFRQPQPSPTAYSLTPDPAPVATPAATPDATKGASGPSSSKPPARAPVATTWQTIASRAAQASMHPGAPAAGPAKGARPTSMSPPRASLPPVEALDAAGKQKRIEQMFARNAFDEALPVIRALVAEDANNPQYRALLGYALLVRSSEGVPKEVVDEINSALRLNEDEPRALYTKALSYKRAGKEREALHYFKRTVAVEPGHIEAAREIRRLGMRATSDDKDKKGQR